MYHSDIYYDLFQLKVCRKSEGKYVWMIQLCGLPKGTNSIGVKFDIFALNGRNHNDDKIKILSQIITFSYRMAVFDFSDAQNNMLHQLFRAHNGLVLLCKANIVQKYAQNIVQRSQSHMQMNMNMNTNMNFQHQHTIQDDDSEASAAADDFVSDTEDVGDVNDDEQTKNDTKQDPDQKKEELISSKSKQLNVNEIHFIGILWIKRYYQT